MDLREALAEVAAADALVVAVEVDSADAGLLVRRCLPRRQPGLLPTVVIDGPADGRPADDGDPPPSRARIERAALELAAAVTRR